MTALAITLRAWETADLPALLHHAHHEAIARNMTDGFPWPYTEEAGIRFLNQCAQHDPAHILAIDCKGEAIGAIGVHPLGDIFRKNAELGYWLSPEYHGQGIMTQALRQMTAYVFAHFTELERLFARPMGRNLASQRVLEKAGFRFEYRIEGNLIKNGMPEDECCYAFWRSDWERVNGDG